MLTVKLPPLPVRRIARIVAVLAIALAAGHLVQTLAARKPAQVAQLQTKTPVKIVQLSAGANDKGLVEPLLSPDVAVAPLTVPAPLEPVPVATPAEPLPPTKPLQALPAATPEPVCNTALSLRQEPGAMIGLVLDAGCRPNERVVLRHAGLAVTGRTDADGRLASALPAMAADGQVEVLFTDGTKVRSAIAMPETVLMRRFGVQWQGAPAFVLHGFQDGADYGQAGDISPLNPGQTTAVSGGFLTLLGDVSVASPLMAQVYTYPMDPMISADVVVEASVNGATCGHDLLGETLLSERGGAVTEDLILAMPDCTAIGDFLVLKNLATDMKLAAR